MCEFKIPFAGSPSDLIARARHEIERAGGTFSGDNVMGNFLGKTPIGSIAGTYQIIGQEILIIIAKKPFLLSCKKIEKELRGVMV